MERRREPIMGRMCILERYINPDYSDLRFTTIDNANIPYWIQETNNSAAIVWAKIPALPTSGTQIYLYYGNNGAQQVSNGQNTFVLFDTFENSSLYLSKVVIKRGDSDTEFRNFCCKRRELFLGPDLHPQLCNGDAGIN